MVFDITLNNKFYNAASETLLVSKQQATKQTFLGYFLLFSITENTELLEVLSGEKERGVNRAFGKNLLRFQSCNTASIG